MTMLSPEECCNFQRQRLARSSLQLEAHQRDIRRGVHAFFVHDLR